MKILKKPILEKTKKSLTDALDSLLKNFKLNAFLTNDDIFDCGEIKGFQVQILPGIKR